MKRLHPAALAAATATAIATLSGPATAQPQPSPPQSQTIAAQCTTDPTGGDGVRHSCESQRTVLNAPDGLVFIQARVEGGEVSGNGSEHGCRFNWDNFVEIIPGSGIVQPRSVWIQAYARGPSGHWAGRGWAGCNYNVYMTRYR